MKEFKGTPGPWRVTQGCIDGVMQSHFFVNGEFSANYAPVAKCQSATMNLTNTKANAHLIAAAPELLEALQEAYKELQFHNWHNTKTGFLIETAIAKALGKEVQS